MKKAFLFGTYCLLLSSLCAQPGWLDPSFGQGGIVRTDRNESNDYARDLLVLPDDKLLVGGYTSDGTRDYFCLWRYLPDGRLDMNFGTNGHVLTTFLNTAVGAKLVRLPDGKILLAGHSWNGNANAFALVRYLPNGELDASFGEGGKVLTPFPDYNAIARAMIVQADGKIVLAGHAYRLDSDADDFALARYLPDGSLDLDFGVDGLIRTSFEAFSREWIYDLILQADGKLVAAGFTGGAFALARYLPTGLLDPDFGENGLVALPIGQAAPAVIRDLLPGQGGQLLAVGFSVDTFSNFTLVRFTEDGRLDANFGNDGVQLSRLSPNADGAVAAVRQADGNIIVAGTIIQDEISQFAVARYLANGVLDDAFGERGGLHTAISEDFNQVEAVALQEDGRIVMAGITGEYPYDIALVRYLPSLLSTTYIPPASWTAQLYPNPAIDGKATFSMEMSSRGHCRLDLYDIHGRLLCTFANETLAEGSHQWELDMRTYPKGAYYLSLKRDGLNQTWNLIR